MVGAEQERAAAGVGVGVADFLGAAAPTSDRDEHLESLHAQTDTSDKRRPAKNTMRTGRRITTAIAAEAGLYSLCVRGTFINNPAKALELSVHVNCSIPNPEIRCLQIFDCNP